MLYIVIEPPERSEFMHLDIEDLISRIEEWNGMDVHYEILGGGITNHNYTVTVDKKKYVLRIPGAGTDIFIDRENELLCSIEAGKSGVVPRVFHHLKPENVTVLDFIEGKTLTTEEIRDSDELIRRIVSAILAIHTKATFRKPFNPFDTVRVYMKYVQRYDAPLPDDFDWITSLVTRIEDAMKRNPPDDVACHNDYLSENFLDDGTKIWIIDWEYGGQGDPYFDLGDFAVEHPFTRKQEELIIREYCGDLVPERLYRMLLHKITSDYWWSVWAMIQSKISKIDFDFYTYGNGRFDRLRRNTRDRDFEKWIAEV